MAQHKIIVSHTMIDEAARSTAEDIRRRFPNEYPIRIFGIPRGGIPAAYAVARYLPDFKIVNTVHEADVIIDDLVDSGTTMARYAIEQPSALCCPLFVKRHKEDWYVFPWEGSAELSAVDIPIRLLQYIGEDPNRGGLVDTPLRFLKAWDHWAGGYKEDPKDVLKTFEDGAEGYNEMVLVRNIPVYSHCEHHLAPFFGTASIAYIPNGKIVGLSKLSRLVDIFARRLQVQERMTAQIADAIDAALSPKGVAVFVKCRHLCMESRGIERQGSDTLSNALRGIFLENAAVRAEFFSMVQS